MTSIKTIIIKHLEEEYGNNWCWAGKIDDYIRNLIGSKASNVSRRCRELVKSGILDVCYEQVDGKGPRCAKYRVKEVENTYQQVAIASQLTIKL
jgi:hypothetical protein